MYKDLKVKAFHVIYVDDLVLVITCNYIEAEQIKKNSRIS